MIHHFPKKFAVLLAISIHAQSLSTHAQSLTFDYPAALGFINTDKVTEASGIAVSALTPGAFWTHNDGPKDHIYAFDMSGHLLADFDLSKNPDDIEDIAVGPGPNPSQPYLYIGDIGSNTADRDNVHIYRVPEPPLDLNWANDPVSKTIKSDVENCQLNYPKGKYDAEALLVDPIDRMLYVITKEDDQAHVFRISIDQLADGKSRDLELVRTIPFAKANGATISADGTLVALRREDFAEAWVRNPGESVGDLLGRSGAQIPVVGPPTEPNGEAICFLRDNSGYITLSEGNNQPVYFFRRSNASTPCAEPPKFSSAPTINGNTLSLNFIACPGATIIIERSQNFSAWQQITSQTLNGNAGSYNETLPSGVTFYRLRTSP